MLDACAPLTPAPHLLSSKGPKSEINSPDLKHKKRPMTSSGNNYSIVKGAALEATKQFVDNFMKTLIKTSSVPKRNKY
jgi:hypothetical protein